MTGSPVDPIIPITPGQSQEEIVPSTSYTDVTKNVAATQAAGAAAVADQTSVTVNNMKELQEKAPRVFQLIQNGIMMRIKRDMDNYTRRLKEIRRSSGA